MKRKTSISILIASLIFFSFNQENDLLQKIAQQLEKYYLAYPEEKAFVQTDKPYYMPGESIWFKAYLVEALSNIPDSVSIPLYVELIDTKKGELLDRKILKLDGGMSHGDFELPANLSPGIYKLQAYTNWMRNFKEELFFTKSIRIISSQNISKTEKVNEDDIDMQFFPEGSDLIIGFENKVAFKTIDAAGNGVDLTGRLLSSTGDTIARFKSDHIGMGSFKFKPQANKTYRAIIQFKNIYTKSYDLPMPKTQGMNMIVDNISSKSQIRISINNNIPTTGMLIIGQSRGIVFYASKVAAGTANAFVMVAKEKFPAGIAQFTVFDESLKPHCERIIFIPDSKPLNIQITPDKPAYSTREKTNIIVEVKDQDGKPIAGKFLVSAVDETQIKDFTESETIQSYLLLNADIKGHIENPTYYFDKTNKYAAFYLDLLLMTQGWRRFTWDLIFKENLPPPKYLIEKGLIISGLASNTNSKAMTKPQNLTLMIGRDSSQQFLLSTTNPDGSFLFYGLDFKDSVNVMAQIMKTDVSQKVMVYLHPQNFAKIITEDLSTKYRQVEYDNFAEYMMNTKKAIDYENQLKMNDAIWLSEITVQARKKQRVPDGPRVLYSQPDDVIRGDVSPSALNIFDLIRGRVAGAQITGDRSDPNVVLRARASMSLGGDPLYLLDGAPVTKQTILALNINTVDRVEVIKSLAGSVMYGDQARGGIISVFMKSGSNQIDLPSDPQDRGNSTATYQGYYTQRQFYTPKYSKNANQKNTSDMRSTLYWAPEIKTDAYGKATVSYFNTDANAIIRVYVEGLSSSGKMGSAFINYKVNR